MNIELIPVGPYEVNCAIVWGESKQALIIDPGHNAADIQAILAENGLTVAAILLTHGHADHIHALSALHRAHPAPIYLHPADQQWAFGPSNQIPPYYSVPAKPDTELLNPADSQSLEKLMRLYAVECIETPGHTPGCVCYWFKEDNICFTGDTLFKGSAGRTDLPGGNARTLTASLKKLAEMLPGDTRIVAGHGDDTTMAYELATNFFLQRFND